MWIVLTILKWIGFIFGGILALLLFFSALVIFVPLRYYVRVNSQDKLTYSYCFRWLAVVAVRKGAHSDKVLLTLFGIPVKCLAGGKKKTEKKKDENPASDDDNHQSEPPDKGKKPSERPLKKRRQKRAGLKRSKSKKSFSFAGVSSIIGLIKESRNRRVIKKLLREILLLIRYLSPTRVRGRIIVGTGDPCTTGMLLGGISLFPAAYQDGVRIVPDFEEKHFEADGFIKGKIRMIYFLRLLHRLYQDRELKALWKQINKVKKEAA